MRLAKLQVSGFKSFVDPTDIRLPANVVAVVGPNGCGKSNIIDAVRWVMGETSAKTLRGDQMADVIFAGSSSRKPVGKAAVELVFDNSDGTIGGNFAGFAEISVKRTLSRDGHSNYYINGIRTRRKDVLDLFRGTGLGPRSYSIIEQGMVSRIVEARPDDLRLFVEEAAGTSKYKERRRETESRIAHTRENLARVADIREQLDKQLRRLKRQASAAKRYRKLKEEQRLVDGQLLALGLLALEDKLAQQDRLSAQCETRLDAALTAQRESETEIEQLRQQHDQTRERHNRVQRQHDNLGAEITNAEQRIEHLKETRRRRGAEAERLRASRAECQRQIESDQSRLDQLQDEQSALTPEMQESEGLRRQAEAQLAQAESAVETWQAEWEAFTEQSQAPARQQEVQQSRIAQLQRHLERSTEQTARLEEELAGARRTIESLDIEALRAEVAAHDQACERSEGKFHRTEESLQHLIQAVQRKRDEGARLQALQREAQSRLTSLGQIQAAALGGDDQALQDWLLDCGLASQPKLAARISVADGWERAADRLLKDYLGAVCVARLPDDALAERPDCAFALITDGSAQPPSAPAGRTRLLDKVEAGESDLSGFLGGVYVAESLAEAVAMQPDLSRSECVATRDGALVGANWISFVSQSQLDTGVLAREEEINQLQDDLRRQEAEVAAVEGAVAQLQDQQEAQRQEVELQRLALNDLRRQRTELHSALGREEARYLEVEQRIAAFEGELGGLGRHLRTDRDEIATAQGLLQQAAAQQGTLGAKRDALLQQKAGHRNTLARRKDELAEIGEQLHQQALHKQRLEGEIDSIADGIARLQRQCRADDERLAQLSEADDKSAAAESGDPLDEVNLRLQDLLARRGEIEGQLAEAGDAVAQLDDRIAHSDQQRAAQREAVDEAREILERHRLDRQEILVRRDTQMEQIDSRGYHRQTLLADLPQDATVTEWETRSAQLAHKIGRLGAVNLVAIEEFEAESERKEYLDTQHADLSEALDTLRGVMQRIDRETRTRFKQTFERLNVGFNEFFPQLFGGGRAELQLTGDDLLTTGVVVMARPPGKRNSHIHLLSGGEKALTAVALLFALFQLNPAPFCLLDEVDAPLDDANVARYCHTLKTMVGASQMIVVTHNKITMEAADVLLGVTMGEPGVSRLVSVDIEQAAEMAAS